MAYDLIGVNSKSPIGLHIRYNVWKWADILIVLEKTCYFDKKMMSNFLFCDGYFVNKKLAEHIKNSITNWLATYYYDSEIDQESHFLDFGKFDKLLEENIHMREYSVMPGYRKAERNDLILLLRFIDNCHGFRIE